MEDNLAEQTQQARHRLRRLAHREPWPLELIEPQRRPLIDAFLLGLAAGGLAPAQRLLGYRIRRLLR